MYRQTPTRTLYLYLTVQKTRSVRLKKSTYLLPIDYSLWGCCVSRLAGGLRLKVLAAEIGVGILSIIMACTLGCVAKYTKRGEMRIKRDWIANDHYTLQHSTNFFFRLGIIIIMRLTIFSSAFAVLSCMLGVVSAASYSNPLRTSNGGDPNIVFHEG